MDSIDAMYAALEGRKRGTPVWVWVIGLAAVLLWNLLTFPDVTKRMEPLIAAHDLPAIFGYMAGGTIVIALIVGAISYVAFLRDRRSSPAYFLSLFLVPYLIQAIFVGWATGIAKRDSAEERAQTRTAVAEIRSTMDAAAAKDATPRSLDGRVKATGAAGAIEGVVKRIVAQQLADRNAYLAEFSSLGYPGFLQPARLRTPAERAAAHAKLQRARLIVAKYRTQTEQHMHDYRTWAEQMDAPPGIRQTFLHGMDEAQPRNTALQARIWTIEAARIDELDQQIDVLSAANGHWIASGKKLLFQRPADLQAYRAHKDRIHGFIVEEQGLQQSAQDRMTRSLGEWEQNLSRP